MIVLDKLLVGGIGWVLRRVADAADAEAHDEAALREELLAAEMQLELGEIDEAELGEIERDVLARIREVQRRKRGGEKEAPPGGGGKYTVEGVEADAGEE